MSETRDVGGEARDVVDPCQRAVLPILLGGDDGPSSLDLRRGPVSEANTAADASVEAC